MNCITVVEGSQNRYFNRLEEFVNFQFSSKKLPMEVHAFSV